MKSGKISRSIDKPVEGFTFKREGYEIYISYIDSKSIKLVEVTNGDNNSTEYEYNLYNYYGSIDSYEELVSKAISLKYSIEEELSLMAKAITDSTNKEYKEYRDFVDLCKTECNNKYLDLGLIKKEI